MMDQRLVLCVLRFQLKFVLNDDKLDFDCPAAKPRAR